MEKKYVKWMLLLAMAFPVAIVGCADDGGQGSGDRYDPDEYDYDDGDEGMDERSGSEGTTEERVGGDVGESCRSNEIPICSIDAPNPRDRTLCVFSECNYETEVCSGTCQSVFCDPGEGEDACIAFNAAEQMKEESRQEVTGTPPSVVTRFSCMEGQNDIGETVHICLPTLVDVSPEEEE